MMEFVPQILVRLKEEVASLVPYQDAAHLAMPVELQLVWQTAQAVFPDIPLSLDAVYREIDPATIVAQLKQNEAEHGTASMPLLSWFRVPAPPGMAGEIANVILDLPFVDLCYEDTELPVAVSSPADDPLAAGQTWQAPAPVGVDGQFMFTRPFTDGAVTRFIDIEYSWNLNHEDLLDQPDRVPTRVLPTGFVSTSEALIDHGTAVLGIVAGRDNDRGIIGLAPKAQIVCAPSNGGNLGLASTLAFLFAGPDAPPGTVVLVELEDPFHFPIEVDPLVRALLRELTRKHVTVIEPAGNGGHDLDTAQGGLLNLNNPNFLDTGTIMVAAGTAASPRQRLSFSNFGNRIDCHAWGHGVRTCSARNNPALGGFYQDNFAGTSSASAIVAGVAVVLQNIRRSIHGDFLTPFRLRALLSDDFLNTPPADGELRKIRVMPDLRMLEAEVQFG